jgi:hypothetical protein
MWPGVTSLGVLAGSIAHEVNQPLSGIVKPETASSKPAPPLVRWRASASGWCADDGLGIDYGTVLDH